MEVSESILFVAVILNILASCLYLTLRYLTKHLITPLDFFIIYTIVVSCLRSLAYIGLLLYTQFRDEHTSLLFKVLCEMSLFLKLNSSIIELLVTLLLSVVQLRVTYTKKFYTRFLSGRNAPIWLISITMLSLLLYLLPFLLPQFEAGELNCTSKHFSHFFVVYRSAILLVPLSLILVNMLVLAVKARENRVEFNMNQMQKLKITKCIKTIGALGVLSLTNAVPNSIYYLLQLDPRQRRISFSEIKDYAETFYQIGRFIGLILLERAQNDLSISLEILKSTSQEERIEAWEFIELSFNSAL